MVMKIHVMTTLGIGSTSISSFDAALLNCGIEDVNLIALSSVIPPEAEVVRGKTDLPIVVGDRLYVVMAQQSSFSQSVWSGICWSYYEDQPGGLFLEAHGNQESDVRNELETGMSEMKERRCPSNFTDTQFVVGGCDSPPSGKWVTSLTVATYANQGWDMPEGVNR